MGGLRGWPLVIIIALALLLFAAPKLPAMARNLGQSMRIFKSEVKQMKNDSTEEQSRSGSADRPTEAVEGTVMDGGNDQPTRHPNTSEDKQ